MYEYYLLLKYVFLRDFDKQFQFFVKFLFNIYAHIKPKYLSCFLKLPLYLY